LRANARDIILMAGMNKNIWLVIKGAAVYAVAYLISGSIAYQLITKQFHVGDNPIFSGFLRSEANAAEWAHTKMYGSCQVYCCAVF
jgi:hypothetical protein